MKRNTQKFLMIVMCALSITACKKEQLNDDAVPTNANGNAALITPAPTYTLVRRGADSLAYYDDGRLAKVIHQFGYTQYNYGFNSIVARTYQNGMLDHENTYQLEVNTGRVYEQESKGYTNSPSGAIVTTKTFKFSYDEQGRLAKKYNKFNINERMACFYGITGALKEIKWYGSNNQLVSTTEYFTLLGNPANKLKLNPEYQDLEMFLPIYGTFYKNMPYQVTRTSNNVMTSWEKHEYAVNGDAHVTNFIRTDLMKNKKIETVEFRYKPMRKN